MKAESTTKPNKVAVDRVGDKAIIHLFDNIVNTVNDEGIEVFEYDYYTIEIPFRPGLESIVLSDFEGWAQEAQIEIEVEPTLDEMNRADIDYLAIMMEVDL